MADQMKTYEIGARREISAPPEKIFTAFTSEAEMNRWFSGDTRIDLRVGGGFSNGDGDRGVYREIVIPQRLRFSWETGCKGEVEVLIARGSDRGASSVLIRQTGLALSEKKQMFSAWSWTLDCLKSYLERGQPLSYQEWTGY